MRSNEELENEIEYLRNVIGHLQDEASIDHKRYESLLNFSSLMAVRITALEKSEQKRRKIEVMQ
jgi:hypothetical protein